MSNERGIRAVGDGEIRIYYHDGFGEKQVNQADIALPVKDDKELRQLSLMFIRAWLDTKPTRQYVTSTKNEDTYRIRLRSENGLFLDVNTLRFEVELPAAYEHCLPLSSRQYQIINPSIIARIHPHDVEPLVDDVGTPHQAIETVLDWLRVQRLQQRRVVRFLNADGGDEWLEACNRFDLLDDTVDNLYTLTGE